MITFLSIVSASIAGILMLFGETSKRVANARFGVVLTPLGWASGTLLGVALIMNTIEYISARETARNQNIAVASEYIDMLRGISTLFERMYGGLFGSAFGLPGSSAGISRPVAVTTSIARKAEAIFALYVGGEMRTQRAFDQFIADAMALDQRIEFAIMRATALDAHELAEWLRQLRFEMSVIRPDDLKRSFDSLPTRATPRPLSPPDDPTRAAAYSACLDALHAVTEPDARLHPWARDFVPARDSEFQRILGDLTESRPTDQNMRARLDRDVVKTRFVEARWVLRKSCTCRRWVNIGTSRAFFDALYPTVSPEFGDAPPYPEADGYVHPDDRPPANPIGREPAAWIAFFRDVRRGRCMGEAAGVFEEFVSRLLAVIRRDPLTAGQRALLGEVSRIRTSF